MTGYEGNVIAQRPEAFTDRADQRRVVAHGKIGAADGTLEQHVALNAPAPWACFG